METLKFKTNIKCGGCIATVTPFLNKETAIESWEVDTNTPDKILTVKGDKLDTSKIKNLVKEAGFKIEQQ